MKHLSRLFAVAIFASLPVVTVAATGVGQEYRIKGSSSIAPVRAFDVAGRLVFQFREGGVIPSISNPKGDLVTYEIKGQYVSLPIADQYVLTHGESKVIVEAARKTEIPVPTFSDTKTSVLYGKTPPKEVFKVAAAPIPVHEAKKKLDVTGGFLLAEPTTLSMNVVGEAFDVSLGMTGRLPLALGAADRINVVFADGSLASYRLAREAADFLAKQGRSRPRVEHVGAPKGRIRLG